MTNPNDLFNSKTIQRLCSDVKISSTQKKAANEWLKLLESNQLEKEKQNYFKFGLIVLKDLLGYPVKDDMGYEEGNVEFTFSNKEGKKVICFEAKGTKTKDLFAPQYRDKKEHSTPVKQTWDYMGALNLDYGVTTNYEQFVLIDKDKGTSKYHIFDFREIKNNDDKLKEFIAIFSRDSIIDKQFVTTLYDQSVIEEKEFTKQFYRLFHETRLMLVKEFQHNEEVTKEDAIHYAQLFLNRMTFIFFAEDTGKVPQRLIRDQLLKVLDAVPVSEHSRYACDTIYSLFDSLDKGATTPVQIFGFNGGLFQEKLPPRFFFKDLIDAKFFNDVYQHSLLKKKVKLDEYADKIIQKYKNRINPIITNLLYMSSFDFNSDLNVNILGHIFEQSLTDLEELQEAKTSKRKTEGIFYTPEYVTDFICRNTIIPFLSKNNATTIDDLIKEYSDNVEELDEKFRKIKILDPACGSGAFLLKAVDVLLEIHKQIQTLKEFEGKYSISVKGKKQKKATEQFTLTKWNEESEARKIIESNIFGIDLNEESTEITKLSLFLKIATNNRKLIDLSKNIRVGNSLVDDKKLDSKTLYQKAEFKEIFDNGGFDVIIGNPPYIPTEFMNKKEKDYYSKNYESVYRKYDSSILFVEKCMNILQTNGYLGFIMPLTWQTGDNYPLFRRVIFQKLKTSLSNLVNLPFDVFPDAYVDTGIVIFQNQQNKSSFHAIEYQKNEKINTIDTDLGEKISFSKVLSHPELKVFPRNATYEYSALIRSGDIEELGTISDSTQGIVTSKYPVSEKKESKNYMPFLLKADANRYKFQIRKQGFIDSTSIQKILHLYTQPKIMIRRIVNRQNRLMAFYEDGGIVTNKDYNPFVITSSDYDIFYILALINSRLFSYWYIKKSSLALKDDFRQTTLSEIRKFGIKKIDKNKQKNFSNKAKKITKLIGEYFELKDKVHRRISENFKIKINKKLEQLQEIDFITLNNEIEKLTKQKLSLQDQDEWEKYFLDNVKKLTDLQSQIVIIDNEIDQDVYKLYSISDSERKLVEQNVFEQRL